MILKRFLFYLVIVAAVVGFSLPVQAAMTQSVDAEPTNDWWEGNPWADVGWIFLQEVETIIEARTLESGYLTMTNGAIIANETDTQISFTEDNGTADEDLVWDFGTDTIVVTSATGVVTMNWGAIVPTANQMLLTPVATGSVVGTDEGTVFYDSTTDTLKYRNASAWISLTTGTGDNTLDLAYDEGGGGVGKKINADTGGVEIEVANNKGTSTYALLLDYDDVTNNNPVLMIENAGTGNSIDIEGTSGNDIEGTGDVWTISYQGVITTTGALTAASGDFTGAAGITLQNDETITNATDTEIRFTDSASSQYLAMDFVTNEIDFKSGSIVTVGRCSHHWSYQRS